MKEATNQSTIVARFNIISVVLLAAVVAAFFMLVFVNRAVDDAEEERFDLTVNAIRFANGSSNLTNAVRAFAATGEKAHRDAYFYELDTAKNRDIGLARMKEIGITDEEQRMIDRMSSISNNLVPLEDNAMETALTDRAAAIAYVFGPQYQRDVDQIHGINAEFRKSIDDRSWSRVVTLKNWAAVISVVNGIMIAVIVVLQFMNMRYTKRELISPIQRIQGEMIRMSQGKLAARLEMEPDSSEIGRLVEAVKMTKRELKKYISDISTQLSLLASGRLDSRVEIDYIGDFAPIKDSIEHIIGSFNKMIGRISGSVTETAEAITERAENVSRGSDELAHGSSEQANVVDSMSAKVHELADRMDDIAEKAAASSRSTKAAAAEVASSTSRMEEMRGAMHDISEASEGIKKITETIANIGSRTNIVAINAAIEAAKAGDVGRGFAVVADEVRKLASMCGDASRETSKLLDETMRSVERGVDLSEAASESLAKLMEASNASASSIQQIADFSHEQAEALKEVSVGFEGITSVVEENAATAEVSAKAATELNEQATKLTELQEIFDEFTLRS